jgi:hypothetical protein
VSRKPKVTGHHLVTLGPPQTKWAQSARRALSEGWSEFDVAVLI